MSACPAIPPQRTRAFSRLGELGAGEEKIPMSGVVHTMVVGIPIPGYPTRLTMNSSAEGKAAYCTSVSRVMERGSGYLLAVREVGWVACSVVGYLPSRASNGAAWGIERQLGTYIPRYLTYVDERAAEIRSRFFSYSRVPEIPT